MSSVGDDQVRPPSLLARYQTFHAPVLLSIQVSRKSPVPRPAIAGKLALAVVLPSSERALHVAPPSVERLTKSLPLLPVETAPEYSTTSVPLASPAIVVVDEVLSPPPELTVSTTTRLQLAPPLVVRQTSMSMAPVTCLLPPGYFDAARTAVPFGSTARPFG